MSIDAWFVVKDDGTAASDGGRYTTKPTGSFAALGSSNYYGSIPEALNATTPPTKDSIIIVSSLHDFTAAGSLDYANANVIGTLGPFSVSVNDAAMDQSLIGARERTGVGSDFTLSRSVTAMRLHGVSVSVSDDVNLNFSNSALAMEKGSIDFSADASTFLLVGDGVALSLTDLVVSWPAGSTTQAFRIDHNARVDMTGGKLEGGSGTITDLVGGSSAGSGGLAAFFEGVDLSDVVGYLLSDVGAATSHDSIDMKIDGCMLSDSLTGFIEDRFISLNHSLIVTNSSPVSSAAQYQSFLSLQVGDIEDQDSLGIVRIEADTYDSGEQTSLKITTTAECSMSHPLVIPINSRFCKLSTSGENTLTINLAVANTITLTDSLIYLRAQNPSESTKNLWDYADTRNEDILSSGTTLDAGTGDWQDGGVALSGYNEYSISITIIGGADCYPLLELVVMEPSIAGNLYISRAVEVS